MTNCKFESVITGAPVGNPPSQPETPVDTDIDTGKTDSENLDAHIDDLATSPSAIDGVSVETKWPGLPAGDEVVTPRNTGESLRSWMQRHETRCTAALIADPIDC
jgi:hypothetical protein